MSIEQYLPRAEMALAGAQDVAVQRLGDWAQSAQAAYEVAEKLSQTTFVPQAYRGKPMELTAAILTGLEVGLSPMAAMRSFDPIQGQSAAKAITLRAIVQSHGHELVLIESTSTRCRMKGKRKGSDEWQSITWTIERARDLGLLGKDNWKKQPAAMLMARATSELARLIASDAILGIGYSSEEIADGGSYDQQVTIDTTTTPEPTGTRRMSRQAPGAPVSPVEGDPEAPHQEAAPTAAETSGESPYLNTSGALAKRMFATLGDLGITQKADRLTYVSDVLGREIGSSAEMTDADAEAVISAATDELLQRPDAVTAADALPEGGE